MIAARSSAVSGTSRSAPTRRCRIGGPGLGPRPHSSPSLSGFDYEKEIGIYQCNEVQHCHAVVGVKVNDAVRAHDLNIGLQLRECVRKIAGRFGCVNHDFVQLDPTEIVDDVITIFRTEDKPVWAAYGLPRTVGRLEIAPHVIRGISSADENVSPSCGTATPCDFSITDEGVGAAFSTYQGIVSARGGADHHIGI